MGQVKVGEVEKGGRSRKAWGEEEGGWMEDQGWGGRWTRGGVGGRSGEGSVADQGWGAW